jgi:acyl carrier protein
MTDEDILQRLTAIFREIFMDDTLELTPETTADNIPGWDSIKYVEIILEVESTFGIKMKTREIDRLKNIGDFLYLIKAKSV